ncbi:MAG: hypothetical protein LQ338_000513 [Usnochroma carphineum]|nr:MAG: hypothetical protein LQ338_000513 [Usnochroma carphineum]
MSATSTLTVRPSGEDARVRLRPVHLGKEPSQLLNLPPEIRLEIYSYLLPDISSYPTGISEPQTAHQVSLRQDSKPACPATLFTCKKIYHEAIPFLYHNRCFNFDIAGHLLQSVANRYKRITTVNFRAWLGLSSYFKQHWPTYDMDNLDYTRLEEICVTFWPVHGCVTKLDEARRVTADLCGQLKKASRLRRVSIRFRDVWPAPQVTAATLTCRHMTEVEYLLQPFKTLKGIEQVDIEMPAYRMTGSESELPIARPILRIDPSDRIMQQQLQVVEEIRALMMEQPPLIRETRGSDLEFEIVVAHYYEDLSWLKQSGAECCVYSKGGNKNAPELPFAFEPLPNIGREGHTFLYHIVNNYDNLAEVTLFVQGRIDDRVDITLEEMKRRALTVLPG